MLQKDATNDDSKTQQIGYLHEVRNLLGEGEMTLERLDLEKVSEIAKRIKSKMRKEKKKEKLEMISKELDIRDRWLGIRRLKNNYQPSTYSFKDDSNQSTPREETA